MAILSSVHYINLVIFMHYIDPFKLLNSPFLTLHNLSLSTLKYSNKFIISYGNFIDTCVIILLLHACNIYRLNSFFIYLNTNFCGFCWFNKNINQFTMIIKRYKKKLHLQVSKSCIQMSSKHTSFCLSRKRNEITVNYKFLFYYLGSFSATSLRLHTDSLFIKLYR